MSLILAGSISLDSTFRILLQAAKISWFFPHPLSDQLEDIPWDAEPMTESRPALQTGSRIRIHIQNVDPDPNPATQINADPIHNPDLDVSTLQRPVLILHGGVFTTEAWAAPGVGWTTGAFAATGHVYNTGAWAAPGRF